MVNGELSLHLLFWYPFTSWFLLWILYMPKAFVTHVRRQETQRLLSEPGNCLFLVHVSIYWDMNFSYWISFVESHSSVKGVTAYLMDLMGIILYCILLKSNFNAYLPSNLISLKQSLGFKTLWMQKRKVLNTKWTTKENNF